LGLKATARKRMMGRTRMLTITSQKAVMGENFVRTTERARGNIAADSLLLDMIDIALT
jgi:hypothetical protein